MRRLRSILQTIRAFRLRGTPAVWNALTSPLAKTIFAIAVLAVVATEAWLWWPSLYAYLAPETPGERQDVVLGVVQAIGVIGIFFGLVFTYQRLRAAERTIQIAQEGQITDRFTRAIQQLGDTKLEVRLGGIYALERIARDSSRDHLTIMEVLTAYVRENAHWKDNPVPAHPASIDPSPPRPAITPRTDIQAILTILRRRPEKARKEERKSNLILDLRDTYLRGADLRAAHMEEANLWAAYMEEADLRAAHMEGANLRYAHMWDAHMEGAYLSGAHMEGAILRAAHMEGVILRAAHMEGAYLSGAHMERANLEDAHMEGAYLSGPHMEGAYLSGAHMEGAYLSGAHMEGANLLGVTGLTREQLASAITDKYTILPGYLKEQGSAPPSSP